MKVFPVIHIGEASIGKSVEQARIAKELNADGVYLIDHYSGLLDTERLFMTLDEIKSESPEQYVGLNILGYNVASAFGAVAVAYSNGLLRHIPDDMWVDDVREDMRRPQDLRDVLEFRKSMEDVGEVTLHGGVAFKYTPMATNNPQTALAETTLLRDYVDVITTSGLGTGKPPTVEKIEAMKSAAEGKPLAVASGIDLTNVESFRGIVDEILVASSVETYPSSGVFDKDVLRDFIQTAHDL